jgi:hypothetical protein
MLPNHRPIIHIPSLSRDHFKSARRLLAASSHCLLKQPIRPFRQRVIFDRETLSRPPNRVATLCPHIDAQGDLVTAIS